MQPTLFLALALFLIAAAVLSAVNLQAQRQLAVRRFEEIVRSSKNELQRTLPKQFRRPIHQSNT